MPLSDFTIKEELGKGAFGSVYLVKRNIDGQEYAMKRVKIIQLDEKEKENALNEIRILASLNHKNIIGYNEAFFDEITRTLNIVMEYANDGDLSKKIKYNLKNGLIFREDVIWDYLIQILEGINYLHENKIMHRDLKSANLFLMKDGTIKIGDLNVSKIAEMGIAYTQIGTPYYASPEIWMDKSYDYKSDIWSIGCIIYELCMLLPPFRGTSINNLSKNIQKGVYQPINNFYSEDLKKIVSMMLVLKPEKRPSSSQLLKSDIILRHIKKEYGSNKSFLNEEKAYLIKTIKMPKNLREINRKLPMKRYKKNQREEMLMNDEYETMKGFLKENENKGIKYNNENEGRIIHKNSHPQPYELYNKKHQGLQNNNRQYAIFDKKNIKNEGNKKNKNIKKDNQVMININKNNPNAIYYPRTPNLATPNYNKYHDYNMNVNIENNNKHNLRKGNIKKTRPKTGSNVINNDSLNKKNKVNKVNLNININNNNNKKPTRAVSSTPANRRAYINKNNNMKQHNNNINRPSTGNPNNKYNQRMINNNPYSNHYINVNRNYHQHNLNNDFNIINEKNIPYKQNNKKKNVIIEKMNYYPSKHNNNIYGYNKHQLIKGKNDKKQEYENERYKNVINRNNKYNYRDYVKKGNNK